MATDKNKLLLGAGLLVLSSVIILGIGSASVPLPSPLGAIAALGMAAGALLVGFSERGARV